MLKQSLIHLSLITTLFCTSCFADSDKADATTKQSSAAAVKRDEMKQQSKAAAKAVEDYAYAEQQELVDDMNRELTEIQAELNRLETKIESTSGTVKSKAKAELEVAQAKWKLVKTQLAQVETATESNWSDVKAHFKKDYADLKEAFERTRRER